MKRILRKVCVTGLVLTLVTLSVFGQKTYEIDIDNNTKLISLNDIQGHLYIKSTSDKKISIEVKAINVDEEVIGLQSIYASGKNTGMGLSVDERDGEISISGLIGKGSPIYTIRIPDNIPLKMNWRGEHFFGEVKVEGHKSSIEMRRVNGDITLTDVTGPMSLYAMDAKLEVTLSDIDNKGPISISTFHSDIKLRLDNNMKADLKMRSGKGEMFTEFEIEDKSLEKEEKDDCVDCVPRVMTGKLNGGGVSVTLNSYAGNIYLIKKH